MAIELIDTEPSDTLSSLFTLPSIVRKLQLDDKHHIAINKFIPCAEYELFNHPDFFKLHAGSNDLYVQLLNAHGKVCAVLCFYELDKHEYVSPKRGTYGGLSLYEGLEISVLDAFLAATLTILKGEQAKSLTIKLAPFSHDLALSSLMTNILLRIGFQLRNHELNYHMDINSQEFISRISYGNKKRIRKCLREGFVADYHPLEDIALIYEVIRVNRARRGFPLTMTLEQLQTMLKLFPERYHLFSVKHQAQEASVMVSSAICIAVSPTILYVFYWGDIAGYERYSPIALLAERIYQFCQQEGYTQLDVGTSSLNSLPSYGIAQFKRNLGFSESLKPEFSLELI